MSKTAPVIRPATANDLSAVLDLYAQPDFDDGRKLSLAEAKAIFRRFSTYPDYTLYVAEQDNRVVGCFTLLLMENLGHLGAFSGIVEGVAVDPAWQSRGIGQAMMAFACERCRAKGCYKLMLSSNAKRIRAHAFYESLGFERHGYSFRIDLPQAAA
ncbi:MAG: GNAT family N-acetyltransferase [Pseudorhodoplanes sp.]